MRRLDCSFLFGILIVVFAWMSPGGHWTRAALLVVGLLIVLHSFSPCFCKTCEVPKTGSVLVKRSTRKVKKAAKKITRKKTKKRKK